MNKVFLDSINGSKARLIFKGEEFVLPAKLLPKTAKEGDWLTVCFEIDGGKTSAAKKEKKECEELLAELQKR